MDLSRLPPLIVGGAVFNTQYSDDPRSLPVKAIVDEAFEHGLNAIDTSPYYGASEELLGEALHQLSAKWPREKYFICTKAGRIRLDEFDYSRRWVRQLVVRLLERLHTPYLDLVYMHDIEFVDETQVYEALAELKALKEEGLVKNIGVSGYPVELLYEVAVQCQRGSIGPLDAILSYSNGCIQNTILFEYYDKFVEAGVRKLMNGLILSMSLLRLGITHAFHPAPQALKDSVHEVSQWLLKQHNVELADLATRFALKQWLYREGKREERNAIVIGVSNLDELHAAIANYKEVNERDDDELVSEVQKRLGPHLNETWASGRFKGNAEE